MTVKKFKALKNATFSFKYPTSDMNTVNVLIGKNGCGKSCLLSLIQDAGHLIKFEGVDIDYKVVNSKTSIPMNVSPTSLQNRQFHVDKPNNLHTIIYIQSVVFNNIEPRQLYVRDKNNKHPLVKVKVEEIDPRVINKKNKSECVKLKSLTLGDSPTLDQIETKLKDLILYYERQVELSSPKDRMEQALERFNSIFSDIDLSSKVYDCSNNSLQFQHKGSNEKFFFDDLSSGEKQLYIKLVELLLIDPSESLILIDEPELSLHPTWQSKFIKILKKIGKSNQIIMATHSPYIINSLNPDSDSLIVMTHGKDRQTKVENNAHLIERTIDNILSTVMESGMELVPNRVKELKVEYRKFVEDQKENIPEALSVKEELLKYESDDSTFFQEMQILIMIR